MAEIEIVFTESEVALVLWVLAEAADLAEQQDVLASLALIEEALQMVRDRFDRRGPTES